MRTPIRIPGLLLLVSVAACSASGPELLVDLETDLVPGVEFSTVETEFFAGDTLGSAIKSAASSPSPEVNRGMRVAVFEGLPLGSGLVSVRLVAADGSTVAMRTRRVDVQQRSAVVVRIHRSCALTVCPDTAAPSCIAGQCVSADCDSLDSCGTPECTSASDCDAPDACAAAECREGACYYVADNSLCTRRDEVCHPVDGCIGGPVDAGTVDAGRPDSGDRDASLAADTGLSCDDGFADCDRNPGNGCEVNLASSDAHCGRCANPCDAVAGATNACERGSCSIVCNSGFEDCDGRYESGCEIDTTADSSHCGRCANACPDPAHGTPTCSASLCGATCDPGYATCTGPLRNSLCGTNLFTDVSNCGSCGNSCPLRAGSVRTCSGRGGCGYTCSGAFLDCDRASANGCEVDSAMDRFNCGTCGMVCAAGRVCDDSECVLNPR